MKNILMVSPVYFDIQYAINPYMISENGHLQKIDTGMAHNQWENLKKIYEMLGFHVDILSGIKDLPDMVFCANQSFPFWNYEKNCPAVILSNMRSDFRKNEVSYFKDFYSRKNYQVLSLEGPFSFEGNGDALIRPNQKQIWGGYGFRTDIKIYEEIRQRTNYELFLLELKNEYFYHLDTCFSFLNSDTVAIVPDAFTREGQSLIEAQFKNIIEINTEEAKNNFAGNCHSPDGKHVILHAGATQFKKELKKFDFTPIELDTSEFMKSGGSVFCMKMMYW